MHHVPRDRRPSAKATRLDRLQLDDPGALDALLAAVGDGPYDVALPVDSELVGVLKARGFTQYAQTVVMARRIDGFREIRRHRRTSRSCPTATNGPRLTRAEALAMADFSFYRRSGHRLALKPPPAGGLSLPRAVATRSSASFRPMPSGWINWIGVVPDARRQGIGRALVGEIAMAVRDAVGSHVVCEVDNTADAIAMWLTIDQGTHPNGVAHPQLNGLPRLQRQRVVVPQDAVTHEPTAPPDEPALDDEIELVAMVATVRADAAADAKRYRSASRRKLRVRSVAISLVNVGCMFMVASITPCGLNSVYRSIANS